MSKSRITHPAPSDNSHAEDAFPFGANATAPATAPPEPSAAEDGRPTADASPDPFDPATYRVHQNLGAAAGVQKVMTGLPVYPPNKAWWCRVHPDAAYSLTAWVIELKDPAETYLVLPALYRRLVGEATFKPKTFFLAVNMQGKPFLWPVRRPADDTKEPDKWMRAPLEAVRLARDGWVRISWNEQTRQHDVATCESTAAPEWPDLPFRELLELAFKNFVIDRLDHPVLRRLRGEAL
jgi:hypothetical protein